ncbi:sigma 54-interacting transcriptional regulator [Pyxidicoccus parkwayensis]|uniref:Sigma 54-interacting transcriptional regulator n=1 Tax=Pyxidicoccus parkwayensis TaxID=2813578 RepID=A0ABX7NWP8_9BACT|nr:sigma 54-interacting transcriptional regulator [Pyxidicoccus parkwaysis]QSQ23133.1 sigma 54-interacting transcriptional regulator [Pyxidicoccus parkwaysis]
MHETLDESDESFQREHTVCRLVVVHGRRRGAVISLGGTRYELGREEPDAYSIDLQDDHASRRHAQLLCEQGDGRWCLVDLGSRNGTFVNGARIDRVPLHDGDVLRVGSSLLLFEQLQLPPCTTLLAECAGVRGPSLQMQRIRGDISLVAPRPLPVLVLGETGTGKERVAEELHRQSGRTGRFIPVNCSAISAELAESELFGHVAGSFTGAVRSSEGVFRAAHRGTLFLDEVGDMPLALQPKLLRALSKGEVRAVGCAEATTVDVRIIAATHHSLSRAVEQGLFRADLLARLAGWTMELPPLRRRKEDILPFARLALERAGSPPMMSASAAEALLLHDWPLNVREVEQCMGAAAVRANGGMLQRHHLPASIAGLLRDRELPASNDNTPPSVPLLETSIGRDRVPSREELWQVLLREQGNVARAALFFGKDRRQVYRWAERLGLDVEAARHGELAESAVMSLHASRS